MQGSLLLSGATALVAPARHAVPAPPMMSQPDASDLFHRTVAHTRREAETYAPAFAPPLGGLSVAQHRTLGEPVQAGYPTRNRYTDRTGAGHRTIARAKIEATMAPAIAGLIAAANDIEADGLVEARVAFLRAPGGVITGLVIGDRTWYAETPNLPDLFRLHEGDDAADAMSAHLTAERVGGA